MKAETFIVVENVLDAIRKERNMMTKRRYRREQDLVQPLAEYEVWLDRVSRVLGQLVANGAEVPDDISWRSFFQSGLSPDEAVRQATAQDYIQIDGNRESRKRRRTHRREHRHRRLTSSNKYESNLLASALVLTDRVAANETRKKVGLRSRRAR